MSYTTGVVFSCDRCGQNVSRIADRKAAEEALPLEWREVTIQTDVPPGDVSLDLCGDCVAALGRFLNGANPGEGRHYALEASVE